jgi:serine/threonine protein kinase
VSGGDGAGQRHGDTGDALIGTLLDGRFHITGVIGEGGMGRVYRATQLSVDRDVAIKTIRSVAVGDDEALQRFRREA